MRTHVAKKLWHAADDQVVTVGGLFRVVLRHSRNVTLTVGTASTEVSQLGTRVHRSKTWRRQNVTTQSTPPRVLSQKAGFCIKEVLIRAANDCAMTAAKIMADATGATLVIHNRRRVFVSGRPNPYAPNTSLCHSELGYRRRIRAQYAASMCSSPMQTMFGLMARGAWQAALHVQHK